MFGYIEDFGFQKILSHLYLDDIADFDIVGSSGDLAVHGNVFGIAHFVGDGTAFYKAGNLEIFVKTYCESFL